MWNKKVIRHHIRTLWKIFILIGTKIKFLLRYITVNFSLICIAGISQSHTKSILQKEQKSIVEFPLSLTSTKYITTNVNEQKKTTMENKKDSPLYLQLQVKLCNIIEKNMVISVNWFLPRHSEQWTFRELPWLYLTVNFNNLYTKFPLLSTAFSKPFLKPKKKAALSRSSTIHFAS